MAVKHRLQVKHSSEKPCSKLSTMVGLGEHKEFLGMQLHNVIYTLKSHLAGTPCGHFSEASSTSLAQEIYQQVMKVYFRDECMDFERIKEHLHHTALVDVSACLVLFLLSLIRNYFVFNSSPLSL